VAGSTSRWSAKSAAPPTLTAPKSNTSPSRPAHEPRHPQAGPHAGRSRHSGADRRTDHPAWSLRDVSPWRWRMGPGAGDGEKGPRQVRRHRHRYRRRRWSRGFDLRHDGRWPRRTRRPPRILPVNPRKPRKSRKPLTIARELEGAPVLRGHRARFDALLSELRRSLKQTNDHRGFALFHDFHAELAAARRLVGDWMRSHPHDPLSAASARAVTGARFEYP